MSQDLPLYAEAEAQIERDKADLSDYFYCLAMRMTDRGMPNVDGFIRRQCEKNQIAYPPRQINSQAAL